MLLLLFKFIAGFVGHSAAMMADAVHSLSDFVTDIVVLIFVRISGRPQDEDHDYGHGKYETVATLFPSTQTDMATYIRLAAEISRGEWPDHYDYQPFYYTVFLPFCLSIVSSSTVLVMIMQTLLG